MQIDLIFHLFKKTSKLITTTVYRTIALWWTTFF